MNIKNFEYLRDQIKFTGFGEELEDKLKAAIESGKPEFKIDHHTQFGGDQVSTELSFSRSKQSDMYFFNSYQVSVQKEGSSEKMEQVFYINKGNNITLKEAYNLMQGRAVNKDLTSKEGQVFNAWIQMDFKQSSENGNFKLKYYHQNYGYDLQEALAKHPIRELGIADYKSNLIESLKKGNLQSVTFQKEGLDQKFFIEADPQFKTVNIYNSHMKRLENVQSRSEGKEQSAKKDKVQKETADEDGPQQNTQKRRRRQGVSV